VPRKTSNEFKARANLQRQGPERQARPSVQKLDDLRGASCQQGQVTAMQPLSPLDRARFALERGHRIPEATLPSPIAESWLRCLDFGLNPNAASSDVVTPFAEVARKRADLGALRSLALAEMQALHAQIAGSNFMIAFADATGVVLDTLSDQIFADSEPGRKIIPGSVWNERARGTNALGLAAATGAPAAVYGREHFYASHGALSCMAAPIVDPRGALVGLIDASCANEARQQHELRADREQSHLSGPQREFHPRLSSPAGIPRHAVRRPSGDLWRGRDRLG
jgi:transcriptional regulator of acetoin/glycerol metabolism